ncbi:MAG TPA: excalibur calcium-binding domain-containing protein [Solirubrobacterales bacterium]|nr:excalibur calcium-binding domain-containing protein [Solirubrobacterales bacterium]
MKLLFGALLAIAAIACLAPAPAAAGTDYDCADFANQAEAQEYLEPGDPHRLDADSDGIACEDLPCPCSYGEPEGGGGGGGGGEPMKPPPYRLTKAAARHAARAVARKFARRNPSVERVAMGACKRRAERRIDCRATARGRTATTKTTCHLRITVRAVNRRPKATLASSSCDTRSTARLTAAQARSALLSRGAELAGKRVALAYFERRSATSFMGTVEWTQRPSSTSPREECFALMEASLAAGQNVRVAVIETGCESSAG